MRDLLDLSFSELEAEMAELGQPAFRARQVWEWAWKHLATDFTTMTNVPLELREELGQRFRIGGFSPGAQHIDADEGTEKTLLYLIDGEVIEAVLMREDNRRTVCVSTQVGCPVGCAFCATGQMGFRRNLTSGEIAGQVLHFARTLARAGEKVTHVVVMGMGEPFLNYDATISAIRDLNDGRGFGLGARRFTLSTVGNVPGIRRLAEEGLEINLAVSLHAPTDELRAKLIPVARRWPIREVLAAAQAYAQRARRRVSYEYVLLAGVNDSLAQARGLAALLRRHLAHVNLIPFNPAPGLPFRRPSAAGVDAFRRELLRQGIDATVRWSRGVHIQAGCGQLRAGHLITAAEKPNDP